MLAMPRSYTWVWSVGDLMNRFVLGEIPFLRLQSPQLRIPNPHTSSSIRKREETWLEIGRRCLALP